MSSLSRPRKLLYLSCERQGHDQCSLDQLCIDSSCNHHQLICSNCQTMLHRGHKTITLSKFAESVESSTLTPEDEVEILRQIKTLKLARSSYREQIVMLQSLFDQVVAKLNKYVELYDVAEASMLSMMSSKGKVPFNYDPTMELEHINSMLEVAVKAMSSRSSPKQARDDAERFKIYTRETGERANILMEMLNMSLVGISDIFDQRFDQQFDQKVASPNPQPIRIRPIGATIPLPNSSQSLPNTIINNIHNPSDAVPQPQRAIRISVMTAPTTISRANKITTKVQPKLLQQPEIRAGDEEDPKVQQSAHPVRYRFSRSNFRRMIDFEGFHHAVSYHFGGFALVVLDPKLSLDTVSKVSFRMIHATNVYIGICLESVAEGFNYTLKKSCLNQGMYGLHNLGKAIHHSPENTRSIQRSQFTFATGDIVKVEFNPSNGQLTYKKKGSPKFIQQTDVRRDTEDTIYFCVGMWFGDEVGIV